MVENKIFIEYVLEYTRAVIAKVKSSIVPKYGSTIKLNDKSYRVLNVKYDYELWQLTGDYHYSASISQLI